MFYYQFIFVTWISNDQGYDRSRKVLCINYGNVFQAYLCMFLCMCIHICPDFRTATRTLLFFVVCFIDQTCEFEAITLSHVFILFFTLALVLLIFACLFRLIWLPLLLRLTLNYFSGHYVYFAFAIG